MSVIKKLKFADGSTWVLHEWLEYGDGLMVRGGPAQDDEEMPDKDNDTESNLKEDVEADKE